MKYLAFISRFPSLLLAHKWVGRSSRLQEERHIQATRTQGGEIWLGNWKSLMISSRSSNSASNALHCMMNQTVSQLLCLIVLLQIPTINWPSYFFLSTQWHLLILASPVYRCLQITFSQSLSFSFWLCYHLNISQGRMIFPIEFSRQVDSRLLTKW